MNIKAAAFTLSEKSINTITTVREMHKGWSVPLLFVFAIQMLSSVVMFYIYRTDCFKHLIVSGNIMFQKEYTQRNLKKLNIFKLGCEAPIRLISGHVCTTHN